VSRGYQGEVIVCARQRGARIAARLEVVTTNLVKISRNALVWLLLVLVPAGWIALSQIDQRADNTELSQASQGEILPALSPLAAMSGRMAILVGGQALQQPNPFGTRPMSQLAAAISFAQAQMPEQALQQLQEASSADHDAPEPALLQAVRTIVVAWKFSASGQTEIVHPSPLTDEQWRLVNDRLGWFGQMAQSKLTADAALGTQMEEIDARFFVAIFAAGLWFLGVGLTGIALLITLPILALLTKVRSALRAMPRTQALLGETFIVWMLLFIGLHMLSGRFGDGTPTIARVWLSLSLTFASLIALGWPILRRLSWGELRTAAGLRFEGGLWRLIWMSASSYACALPCMAVGVAIGLVLSGLLGDRNFQDMSHPVQELLPKASGGMVFALFAVACVSAPIVEETMFRGCLYGHVRQQTWGWPRWLSIAFAMLFSATIFAAIHPQGLLAVPALAGVSIGFCITREWSGSVAPGMIAHGLHNGVLLALNLALN